jgi:hypothetical protein
MSLTCFCPRWRVALTTLLLLGTSAFVAVRANAEVGLAATLEQGSAQERAAALTRIRATPVDARGADVLPALLRELDRESARLDARNAALRAGKPIATSEAEGGDLLDVLDLVTQHKNDPRIIPALLPFIATGNRVIDVLAGFGEPSVSAVAAIAASNTKPVADVFSALLALQRMLVKPTSAPLSEASRELIVSVADARLTGTQAPTVALAAVTLAAATGNPTLSQRVQMLSEDPAAVRALGLSAEMVPTFQKKAKAALSSSVRK